MKPPDSVYITISFFETTKMQLIIKTNKTSFLIETPESWTFEKLKLQIGEHLQVEDVNLLSLSFSTSDCHSFEWNFNLWCLDITLDDQVQMPENHVLLSDLKIQALDTIYVNLVSEMEPSSNDAVEADEMNRTIVITKIIAHAQDITQKAIEDTFGPCGAIERMIVQKWVVLFSLRY